MALDVLSRSPLRTCSKKGSNRSINRIYTYINPIRSIDTSWFYVLNNSEMDILFNWTKYRRICLKSFLSQGSVLPGREKKQVLIENWCPSHFGLVSIHGKFVLLYFITILLLYTNQKLASCLSTATFHGTTRRSSKVTWLEHCTDATLQEATAYQFAYIFILRARAA